MRAVLLAAVIGVGLFGAGCSSPIESFCAKGDECGELGSQTYDQCVAEGDKMMADLRAKDACKTVADRFEDAISCAASKMSCADIKNDKFDACKAEQEAFLGAFMANDECRVSF